MDELKKQTIELYINQWLSLEEVATKLKLSKHQLKRRLKKLSIKRRGIFKYCKDCGEARVFSKGRCRPCYRRLPDNQEKEKAYKLNYRNINKEKIRKKEKAYRNKPEVKERRKLHKRLSQQKEKTREWARKYYLARRINDINFKLAGNLRNRLRLALQNNQKTGSAVDDLGCSIEELKKYLENKFQPNMAWDNYGKGGWHIDHIKPLVSFDLTDRKQFLEACHYTNLQPLWEEDNLKKGDTL